MRLPHGVRLSGREGACALAWNALHFLVCLQVVAGQHEVAMYPCSSISQCWLHQSFCPPSSHREPGFDVLEKEEEEVVPLTAASLHFEVRCSVLPCGFAGCC